METQMSFHEDPRRKLPVELQGNFSIEEAQDLISKFEYFDKDASGCIDSEELKLVLKEYDADAETVNKLMGAIDGNRNGQIEFDEFVALMAKRMLTHDGPSEVAYAFKVHLRSPFARCHASGRATPKQL